MECGRGEPDVEDNNLEDTGKKRKKCGKSNSKNIGDIKKNNDNENHGDKQPKLTSFWKTNSNMSNTVSKTNATNIPPKDNDQKIKVEADYSKNKKFIERIIEEKEILKNKYINLQN